MLRVGVAAWSLPLCQQPRLRVSVVLLCSALCWCSAALFSGAAGAPTLTDTVLQDPHLFPPQPIVASAQLERLADKSGLACVPTVLDVPCDSSSSSSASSCAGMVLLWAPSTSQVAVAPVLPETPEGSIGETTPKWSEVLTIRLNFTIAKVIALPPAVVVGLEEPEVAGNSSRGGFALVLTVDHAILVLRASVGTTGGGNPAAAVGSVNGGIVEVVQRVSDGSATDGSVTSLFPTVQPSSSALSNAPPPPVAIVEVIATPASTVSVVSLLRWNGTALTMEELLRVSILPWFGFSRTVLHCGRSDSTTPRYVLPVATLCLVLDAQHQLTWVIDTVTGTVATSVHIPMLGDGDDGMVNDWATVGDGHCDSAVILRTNANRTGAPLLTSLLLQRDPVNGSSLTAKVSWNYTGPTGFDFSVAMPVCRTPTNSVVDDEGATTPGPPRLYPTLGIAVCFDNLTAPFKMADLHLLRAPSSAGGQPAMSDGRSNVSGAVSDVQLATTANGDPVLVAVVQRTAKDGSVEGAVVEAHPLTFSDDGQAMLVPNTLPSMVAENVFRLVWTDVPVTAGEEGGLASMHPGLVVSTTYNTTQVYLISAIDRIAMLFKSPGPVSFYPVKAMRGSPRFAVWAVYGQAVQHAPTLALPNVTWAPPWCTGIRSVVYPNHAADAGSLRVAWLSTNGSAGGGCTADVLVFVYPNGSMSADPIACVSAVIGSVCPGCVFQMLYDATRQRVALMVTTEANGFTRSLAELFDVSPGHSRGLAQWVVATKEQPVFVMVEDWLLFVSGGLVTRRWLINGSFAGSAVLGLAAQPVQPFVLAAVGNLAVMYSNTRLAVFDAQSMSSSVLNTTQRLGDPFGFGVFATTNTICVCDETGSGSKIDSESVQFRVYQLRAAMEAPVQAASMHVRCDSQIHESRGFLYLTAPSSTYGMIMVRLNASDLEDATYVVADPRLDYEASMYSMLSEEHQLLVFSAATQTEWYTYCVDLVTGSVRWTLQGYQIAQRSAVERVALSKTGNNRKGGIVWLYNRPVVGLWLAVSMFTGATVWTCHTADWPPVYLLNALSDPSAIDLSAGGALLARYEGEALGLPRSVQPPSGFRSSAAPSFPSKGRFPVTRLTTSSPPTSPARTTGTSTSHATPPSPPTSTDHIILISVLCTMSIIIAVLSGIIYFATRRADHGGLTTDALATIERMDAEDPSEDQDPSTTMEEDDVVVMGGVATSAATDDSELEIALNTSYPETPRFHCSISQAGGSLT